MKAEISGTMDDKNYAAAMESAARKIVLSAGISIAGQASLLAPVDTGRLAGSITYATSKRRGRVKRPAKTNDRVSQPSDEFVAYVGTNVEYAAHIEYGTARGVKGKRKQRKARAARAKPYLRPAMQEMRPQIQKMTQRAVARALREGKKLMDEQSGS